MKTWSRAIAACAGVALHPGVAAACAVCFGGKESEWPAAFLAGTVLLLVLPPAIIVTAGVVIYRATKRQEARRAALEDEKARSEPRPARDRALRPV